MAVTVAANATSTASVSPQAPLSPLQWCVAKSGQDRHGLSFVMFFCLLLISFCFLFLFWQKMYLNGEHIRTIDQKRKQTETTVQHILSRRPLRMPPPRTPLVPFRASSVMITCACNCCHINMEWTIHQIGCLFLVACTRLYNPLCPSVGRSVTLSFFSQPLLTRTRLR